MAQATAAPAAPEDPRLLPFALLPSLGVLSPKEASAPYANELIFLFLAGFLLARALEHWKAHERLAYGIVARTGLEGPRMLFGLMAATGLLSMFVSNTATAAMMYPIALALGGFVPANAAGDRTRARSAARKAIALHDG